MLVESMGLVSHPHYHHGVTVTQHAYQQNSEATAAKLNSVFFFYFHLSVLIFQLEFPNFHFEKDQHK